MRFGSECKIDILPNGFKEEPEKYYSFEEAIKISNKVINKDAIEFVNNVLKKQKNNSLIKEYVNV
ncbi:MAG: hypothetical protein Q9M94_01275 [Candidatus Gracilibacteria bacterium]|nr:hypothetical protein [Candidatus Gracilibacteria bacterium]